MKYQSRWYSYWLSSVNHILFDGQQSTGLIKGVSFGNLLPGVNVSKTLYLVNTGAPGDRALDISIRSQIKSKSPPVSLPAATPSSPETSTDIFDKSEALQILTIPTVSPIKITYNVGYKRPLADRPDIANLKTFEDEFWDDGGEALISCRLETVGPWCLELLDIELDREVSDACIGCANANDIIFNRMVNTLKWLSARLIVPIRMVPCFLLVCCRRVTCTSSISLASRVPSWRWVLCSM